MPEKGELTEVKASVPEVPNASPEESADRLRRRLLKAGVAAVPTMISLQSGTAWALSNCATRSMTYDLPTTTEVNDAFGNPSAVTPAQQGNRDLVTAVTTINDADITSIVTGFTGANANNQYPEGPLEEVEEADVMYLLVTNGSCWTSYCAGPVQTGNVDIDGPMMSDRTCSL